MLKDLNIIIGVTGGIACYKVCSLINYLKKEGANINIIMTESATKFITPLTLEVLSKNQVIIDMFANKINYNVEHISLAKKGDIFLIVPATANIIGKVANGIADNMLLTTIMATKAKVIFAPSMNDGMYENKIVQINIKKLKDYGYRFVEPSIGNLACGYKAIGKLADTKTIIDYLKKELECN